MTSNAAEGRIGVLRAAARVLCDDWRATTDADRRAYSDAEPHIAANGRRGASDPYAAADFYRDGCAYAFCDAESKRDWHLNRHVDRYTVTDTDSQRNADHDCLIDPVPDSDGDNDAYNYADGNGYGSAQ